MSAMLKLRDYQAKAIKEIHTRWDSGVRRPAAVLPTGAGKTVVFSHLAEGFLAANPGKRVLILSHTEELGDQAAAKMKAVAPHRSVGIVRAGLNQVHAEIISASVQTLRNAKRREQVRNVGLIVVDECHHATAKTYRTILEHFRGTLCVDELHLGRFTLLLATDPLSDLPVAFALVTANDQDHMRRFLQNLKTWGLNPHIVVTDGSNLYPAVLAEQVKGEVADDRELHALASLAGGGSNGARRSPTRGSLSIQPDGW